MSLYDCHILKSRFVSKTGIFALDSSLVRMKPSRRFLPHTDCDASVATLMHLSTACVWYGYLSNVTTGVVGSRMNSRRSSSLILIVTGGLVTRTVVQSIIRLVPRVLDHEQMSVQSKLNGGTVNCRTPFLFGCSRGFRIRRRRVHECVVDRRSSWTAVGFRGERSSCCAG